LGQELHALFGFAILTVGALMDVEIDVNKYGMYENMNGNGMNEESNKNKKKIKIYSNLFKVL
jgi:predicted HAD superfamily hydrolase